jgi:hypothetical protein
MSDAVSTEYSEPPVAAEIALRVPRSASGPMATVNTGTRLDEARAAFSRASRSLRVSPGPVFLPSVTTTTELYRRRS